MESKRIYRSRKNVVVSGVCGGLGNYFNIDPVIIRVLWVIVGFGLGGGFMGNGVILYIIASIVIPKEPSAAKAYKDPYNNTGDEQPAYETTGDEYSSQEKQYHQSYSSVEKGGRSAAGMVLGLLLVLAGGFFLAANFVDLSFIYSINLSILRDFSRFFWPICLILLGLVFLVKSK